jgi:hypothetical protein
MVHAKAKKIDRERERTSEELTKNIRIVIEGIYWLIVTKRRKNVNDCIKYLLVIVKGFLTVSIDLVRSCTVCMCACSISNKVSIKNIFFSLFPDVGIELRITRFIKATSKNGFANISTQCTVNLCDWR